MVTSPSFSLIFPDFLICNLPKNPSGNCDRTGQSFFAAPWRNQRHTTGWCHIQSFWIYKAETPQGPAAHPEHCSSYSDKYYEERSHLSSLASWYWFKNKALHCLTPSYILHPNYITPLGRCVPVNFLVVVWTYLSLQVCRPLILRLVFVLSRFSCRWLNRGLDIFSIYAWHTVRQLHEEELLFAWQMQLLQEFIQGWPLSVHLFPQSCTGWWWVLWTCSTELQTLNTNTIYPHVPYNILQLSC